MGIGDDVIWLGEAWHRYSTTGQKSRPTRDGRPHTFKLAWANCEYVDMHEGVPLEERTTGLRPYAVSTNYVCRPARFVLSAEEQLQAQRFYNNEPYWLICPDVKQRLHYKNKDWGWRNWGNTDFGSVSTPQTIWSRWYRHCIRCPFDCSGRPWTLVARKCPLWSSLWPITWISTRNLAGRKTIERIIWTRH